MVMIEAGDYLSMEEAMAATGYRRSTITQLCREGKVAGAVKIGRQWIIPRAGLMAYVPGPQGFAARPKTARREVGPLPPLAGTEKQAEWAGRIREAFLGLGTSGGLDRPGREVAEAIRREAARQDRAAWWIEHRLALTPPFFAGRAAERLGAAVGVPFDGEGPLDEASEAFWAEVAGKLRPSDGEALRLFLRAHEGGSGPIWDAEIRARVAEEASRTLRPAEPRSDLIWRIEETEERLSLVTPARDDAVAAMVRRLGFAWSEGAWRRKRPEKDDLAVEVAVRLLAMGLPVRLPRAELAPRVAAGEYSPLVTKIVLASKDRDRFEIAWAREDGDFYDAARRIPGARWISERGRMGVPKDRWAEVQDFADAHGFRLTDAARAMAAEAEAAYKEALVVSPRPKEAAGPKPQAGQEGIDEELLDDD